jgi:hypothetical protein
MAESVRLKLESDGTPQVTSLKTESGATVGGISRITISVTPTDFGRVTVEFSKMELLMNFDLDQVDPQLIDEPGKE